MALLTGEGTPSANAKTGPMLQTWILHRDIKPSDALKSGADTAVCGECPLRNGACYVNVGQAPNAIWRAYQKSKSMLRNNPDPLQKLALNRPVRLGAYGDPAAVPRSTWEALLASASGWTGYTHSGPASFCQESVEDPTTALDFHSRGLYTFRVKQEAEPLLPGEILCPAPKGVRCIDCLLCDGKTVNIAINVHGAPWKQERYNNVR